MTEKRGAEEIENPPPEKRIKCESFYDIIERIKEEVYNSPTTLYISNTEFNTIPLVSRNSYTTNLLPDLLQLPPQISYCFFDAAINLEYHGWLFKKIPVSKYCIAKKSRFFDKLIREKSTEKTFTLPILNANNILDVEQFLKSLHVLESKFDPKNGISCERTLYECGLQFDVPDIFTSFTVHSTKELSYLYNFIEQQDGYIGVEMFRWKPKIWEAEQIFLQKAGEILSTKFQNINDVRYNFKHKEEFVSLPIQAVKAILNNLSIQEYKLDYIMIWMKLDQNQCIKSEGLLREREIYLKELLPFVDLTRISPCYLFLIVSKVIEDILNPEIKQFVGERYVKALEIILQKHLQDFDPTKHILEHQEKLFGLIRYMESILRKHHFVPKNTNDIEQHQHVFNELSFESVKQILETLKNPFCSNETDSEQTYFTIVMLWIEYDRTREIYLEYLLPLVDLSRLSKYFLASAVSKVFANIINPDMKLFAHERYAVILKSLCDTVEIASK